MEQRQAQSGPDKGRAEPSSVVAAGRGGGKMSFALGVVRVETEENESPKQVKLNIRLR